MTGVELIELPTHVDSRGCLVALDKRHGLPFDVRRIFYIFDCPPDAIRGQHAITSDELLVAVRGSLTIFFTNGFEHGSAVLDRPDRALHVRAGIWITLHDFRREAILLVASPLTYAEVTSFNGSQLQFVGHP